jgi:hypothetical protein
MVVKFEFENDKIVVVKDGKIVGKLEKIVKVGDKLNVWKGKNVKVVRMMIEGKECSVVRDYKDELLMIVEGELDKEGIVWNEGRINGEVRGLFNVKDVKVWNGVGIGVKVI